MERFQCGEYWLSQYPKSPFWQRTWYCGDTKQTKRFSLGTRDFPAAQKALTEWYLANIIQPTKALDTKLLDEVVLAYYHGHAVHVRAGTRIKSQLGHIVGAFTGLTVAEACKPDRIASFTGNLLKRGLKPSSINNILTVMKAAVNRSYKLGEIPSAPYIALLSSTNEQPKGRPLKPAEIGSLLAVAQGHTRTMLMLCIATGSRPEALCELTWGQIDFDAGIIELNHHGRAQTKKYRPTIKLPPSLAAYLKGLTRDCEYVVSFRGHSVRRYHEAWKRAKNAAGLEGTVTPYSLRHSAARWMRQQGVAPWEVSAQLGHSASAKLTITERYAAHAPDYLEKACAALESLLQECITWESRVTAEKSTNEHNRIAA